MTRLMNKAIEVAYGQNGVSVDHGTVYCVMFPEFEPFVSLIGSFVPP
jgi:hypothetical protein